KGLGVRTAVFMAQGQIIGFSDADNKTPISEFAKLDAPLRAGAEMAIGSRGLPETVIECPQPLIRRLGSKAFAVVMQLIVGLQGIADSQCGFKFFKADVARYLFERQRIDGYMFDVEILAIALRARFSIAQVPVRWRDDKDSRFHIISGGLRDLRELIAIRLMALRGLYNRPREEVLCQFPAAELDSSVAEPIAKR